MLDPPGFAASHQGPRLPRRRCRDRVQAHRINAPHLVALVRAGAVFKNGKLIERPDESEARDQHVAGHADPQVLTIPGG